MNRIVPCNAHRRKTITVITSTVPGRRGDLGQNLVLVSFSMGFLNVLVDFRIPPALVYRLGKRCSLEHRSEGPCWGQIHDIKSATSAWSKVGGFGSPKSSVLREGNVAPNLRYGLIVNDTRRRKSWRGCLKARAKATRYGSGKMNGSFYR